MPQGDQALASSRHPIFNKVPEITLYFWIIKVLCTTVGETFADFLNMNLGLGLTNTTWLMGGLLVVALAFEFRSRKYVPGLYWLAVVLLSIVGTLVTDNLTDNLGVSLVTQHDCLQRLAARNVRGLVCTGKNPVGAIDHDEAS